MMSEVQSTRVVGSVTESLDGGAEETRQEKCSTNFSDRILEMFPDADFLFLLSECRSLQTEEDCTRFINTVMLRGVYPKRNAATVSDDNEFQILRCMYSGPVVYSPDEKISDRDVVDSGHPRGQEADSSSVEARPSQSSNPGRDFIADPVKNDSVEVEESCLGADVDHLADLPGPRESRADVELKASTDCDASFHRPRVEQENLSGVAGETVAESNPDSIGCSEAESNPAESRDGAEEESSTAEDWLAKQTDELIRLFPNSDPTFLRAECAKFHCSLEAMNEFVIRKLEKNDMPTRKDFEEREEMKRLQYEYTKNFSVEEFVRTVPRPLSYFSSSDRNCAKYKAHSLIFLEHAFPGVNFRDITAAMMENNFNLYLSYKELKLKSGSRCGDERQERDWNLQTPTRIYIEFLQEVAFIENEEKIKDFIKAREDAKESRMEEAIGGDGMVLECKCCFDPEVAIQDVIYCTEDHPFCKPCLVKYVEIEMTEARYEFLCLSGCQGKFSLSTLQSAVKPEVISKIVQAKQREEIQAAEIEDLVECPFCSYAAILPPQDKVLSCLNPECLKETCRLCKGLSHIPLRCNEVEESEDFKMRTYIENKMTEALIRTCYSCGKGFIKEDGCNKIVCQCGAKMCYVCRKPVTGYSHFNGLRGTDYKKCPLYSTNEELHAELVKKAEEKAKADLLKKTQNAALVSSTANGARPRVTPPSRFLTSRKCKWVRATE